MKDTSKHCCDKTIDDKMAWISWVLFSELYEILVNKVTFAGFTGVIAIPEHRKTTCPDLCHMRKDNATKTSPQVWIRKRKKLYKSRTTLCNNSKAVEQRKTYVQGHFWREKSEARLRKNACALLKKYVLKSIVHSTESILTSLNNVLSEKYSRYCFDLPYSNWKRRIYRQIVTHDIVLWQNSHYH